MDVPAVWPVHRLSRSNPTLRGFCIINRDEPPFLLHNKRKIFIFYMWYLILDIHNILCCHRFVIDSMCVPLFRGQAVRSGSEGFRIAHVTGKA